MYAEDFENLEQMVPQTPLAQTSSRPSLSTVPLTKRMSPSLQFPGSN